MIKILLKFIFAGGIVIWLLKSGKLDFSLVQKSFAEGPYWLIAIGFILGQNLLGAWRWKKILDIKAHNRIPYLSTVRLTWIGLFFNSFLPGAVTGDLIKLLYARDLDRKHLSKTFLLTSVVMDRILGLMGLLSVLGVFSLISYEGLTSISPQVTRLVQFNFLLFTGALSFIAMIFLPRKAQKPFLDLMGKIPFLGEKIRHTFEQVWLIGGEKNVVIQTILISFASQVCNALALWTISYPFIAGQVDFIMALSFIPLGFITIALPISPAGLGVGHVAFATLFGYFGVEEGASLFNLYFLSLIFINLLGLIPYLMSSKRHSLEEASDEFEENMTS